MRVGTLRPMRGLVLGVLAAVSVAPLAPASAPDGCYAECADGLRGEDDVGPARGARAPALASRAFDLQGGAAEPRSLGELLDGRPLILAFGSYT